MLFSDWSRTGQRDLRMTNDRHYYRDGSDQLWRVAPGADAAAVHRGRRLAAAADLGDGHRQPGPHRRRLARGVPDEPGRQQAADARRRARRTRRTRTSPSSAGPPPTARTPAATSSRPPPGTPSSPTSTTTASPTCSSPRATSRRRPDYATRDPSNLLIGQADGTFVEGAEAAGIVSYERARGGALVDLNLDGLLDLVVVNRAEPVTLWRNVGAGDADAPAPMGNWVAVRLAPAGAEHRRHRRVGRGAGGRPHVDREVTVGGGHAGGQLGWMHLGLGDADEAEVRVQWPDGEVGPWMTCRPGEFAIIERGAADGRRRGTRRRTR